VGAHTGPASRLRGISRRWAGSDRGAVTAELAVALPAVTMVLAAVLSVAQAVLCQISCVDAARAGARAAARGDSTDLVRQTALVAAVGAAEAPAPAEVAVVPGGDTVSVTVSRPVRLLAVGPVVRLSARAVAQREQTTSQLGGG
jgi:Flp pilus assembly protein TadG